MHGDIFLHKKFISKDDYYLWHNNSLKIDFSDFWYGDSEELKMTLSEFEDFINDMNDVSATYDHGRVPNSDMCYIIFCRYNY